MGKAGMILAAFHWWTEGLATAIVSMKRYRRRPRRFCLEATRWPFLLHPLGTRSNRLADPTEIPETPSVEWRAQIRAQTRGSVFEVAIPAAALLERDLPALPAESEPYLESVVRHQLDSLLPWKADDVIHATVVERRSDGKLAVKVRATSRAAIAPVLLAAAACEAGELLLTGSIGARGSKPITMRVPLDKRAQGSGAGAHTAAWYIIITLLVLAVGAIGWTTFLRWSAASELALLERTITDRRALLTRASTSRATGQGLIGRKLGTPAAVMVLEQLSDVLPDDTHLTELSLEGARLRISGISSQAAELVGLLESSGHFRNAAFYAPTMRIPGSLTDRFSIEAMAIAHAEPKQ